MPTAAHAELRRHVLVEPGPRGLYGSWLCLTFGMLLAIFVSQFVRALVSPSQRR